MILSASLLLCLFQQEPVPNRPLPTRGGDIQLPPPKVGAPSPNDPPPEPEIERFRRDIQGLHGSTERIEQRLFEIGHAYPETSLEPLMLQVIRTARGADLARLMPVCKRFGVQKPRVADELLFQLLSRPLGDATRPAVETLVLLKGEGAKPSLQELVRSRLPAVRRPATDALAGMLTADDLPFVMQLSRDGSLDLQLRGVDLLAALGSEPAQRRLIELLAKDPALAGVACQALARMGERAAPALVAELNEPPIDRGYAYAAFALAAIDRSAATPFLPAAAMAPLAARLADPDPLTRALVAVPLADLVYRGVPAPADGPRPSLDVAVVDVLLDVVEPRSFVANLDLLRQPVEERLLRLTGRTVGAAAEPLAWRDWWSSQRDAFAAVRARIDLDPASASAVAITLRQEGRQVRLLGDGLVDMPPVEGAIEVALAGAQMLALAEALAAGGFFAPASMAADRGLPRTRSLQLSSPQGRCLVAMTDQPHPAFDSLVALVLGQVEAELWQLYRVPDNEPDRGAYWRAERRWLEANPDPLARGRRFAQRVVQHWALWSPPHRARALAHLAAHPQRAELLTAADAELAITVLGKQPTLGDLDLRLLELAAAVPGAAWRRAVELAGRHPGGGPAAVRSVFAVLGPDAVLAALADESAAVRRAGLAELAVVRDQRAAPRLIGLLRDSDDEVKRAAIVACGQMQLAQASRPIVDLIAAEDTDPLVRREAMRALGRVGGELAFPVLQRAFTAADRDDKEAALRGLGELRDPRATQMLADLVVIANGQEIGSLARLHLQRHGAELAVPALQQQLERAQDAAIRTELVLLLGSYHTPTVVPDLLDLLRQQKHSAAAAALLSGTTGLDLVSSDERVAVAEAWYRNNKLKPQWQWLLDALAAAKVQHGLQPEQFVGAGEPPIAELARLLVDVAEPRLWTLCAAVLRSNAGVDHGVVSLNTPLEVREAIAARYRMQVETARAAQGK